MRNSLEKSQGKQDERANGMEDSHMATIEYLRARLLSERSVSKAAKERADELAMRVMELEEQLKIVTLQRKRAEKATLDVLSCLESHGISDISEVYDYESESVHEESECESDVGKSGAAKVEEKSASSELKVNDKQSSDSDRESTVSSSTSLSWKGRKSSTRPAEKKFFDSSSQRRTTLTQISSSPKHRPGKSCRQIKRKEVRPVEESRHGGAKYDAQESSTGDHSDHLSNCLVRGSEGPERFPEILAERIIRKDEVSLSLHDQSQECEARNSIHENERNGQMERALEFQAHLIGRYGAQEQAQKDWEEKYGGNNASTLEACEPGNYSDVTEEREENKAAAPHSKEIEQRPPDHIPASSSGNSFREPIQPENLNAHHPIVPHGEPHRPEVVLNALQEAKLVIERRMHNLQETHKGPVGNSVSGVRDIDRFKISVGGRGLFRVPDDLQGDPHITGPMNSGYSISGRGVDVGIEPGISARQPVVDFDFSTYPSSSSSSYPTFSSYSRVPDLFPRMPSNQLYSSSQFPRSEGGMHQSGNRLFSDHEFRSNLEW